MDVYLKELFFVLFLVTFGPHILKGDSSQNLSLLLRDYYEWRLSDRPVEASRRGFSQYNDQVESFLESDYEKRKNRATLFLIGLRGIKREDLTKTDKLNYDLLEEMLVTFINGYEWRYYNTINPFNLLEGPQRRPSGFTHSFQFNTIGDYENYLSRLSGLAVQIDQRIELMRLAISMHRTYHQVSVNLVLEQVSSICPSSNYSVNCVYYEPFLEALDNADIPVDKRAILRSRGAEAIGTVLNKYQGLMNFLRNEYIPATRTSYGVLNLENGREYYKACLKWYLAVDYTPEEVHQLGKKEVNRIEGEMKKIMMKQNFHGTVTEYFNMIKNDSSMFFQTGEEMLEEYRYMYEKRIKPFMPKMFLDVPDDPLLVLALPSDGPAGRYYRGSENDPGIFYANVLRPTQFAKISMMPLAMHEAVPGHHLQFSYNLLAKSPLFRSKMEYSDKFRVPFAIPSFTAFSEGWALYAEALGEELGLYADDGELMGRYSSEIFRACRLVVDTGIHYYNWTKEESINYIARYTTKSRAAISVEIDRYVTWPGQACTYKIGELKIKELRQRASERLGSKFDVREFHTKIMRVGIIPLNLLERNINDWIVEKLNEIEPQETLSVPCSAAKLSFSGFIIFIFTCFNVLS